MNLPNKLTIFRVILIPFLLIFLLIDINFLDMQTRRYIALAIFVIASLTDALDGYIARKYNLITNFGKFMDPLADKILVISTMLALINIENSVTKLPIIAVIIIIARELFIDAFRLIAVEKRVVISAGKLGKIKTVLQMLMIIFLLLNINNTIFIFITKSLIALSVFFTVISLLQYVAINKQVLKD